MSELRQTGRKRLKRHRWRMGGSRPEAETGKGAAERADSCGETLCRCGKSRVSPKDINRSRFSFSEEKRLLLFEKKLWYHKAKGGMDMELETIAVILPLDLGLAGNPMKPWKKAGRYWNRYF